eukprot:6170388-Lingulodinium_polyedra.AAC.1
MIDSPYNAFSEDTIHVTGIDYTLAPEDLLGFFEASGPIDFIHWVLEIATVGGKLGRNMAYI